MRENKYINGKIYKITDVGYNKCYIGSTCESLCKRLARHTSKYKVYLKGGITLTRSFDLFDEYGVENCKIELIENFPCENKEELRKREGYYIQNTECINKYVAGRNRTFKEYYQDNKEQCNVQRREYKEKHKEELKLYYQERFIKNKDRLNKSIACECGRTYTFSHKARHLKTQTHQNYLKGLEQEK